MDAREKKQLPRSWRPIYGPSPIPFDRSPVPTPLEEAIDFSIEGFSTAGALDDFCVPPSTGFVTGGFDFSFGGANKSMLNVWIKKEQSGHANEIDIYVFQTR